MRRPSAEERDAIGAAVHAAEAGTSGEIVTIVADRSDGYSDVALAYAALAAFAIPALFAALPAFPLGIVARLSGGWSEAETSELMLLTLIASALAFAATLGVLAIESLRMAVTPKAIRRRRVQRRAIELFRVGTEARTTGRTGILIYLSLGEHMAEIVADEAIHGAVAPEAWGDAMAALITEVREGRIAAGMIAAVGQVGTILSAHLIRAEDDMNELPDRLIEL